MSHPGVTGSPQVESRFQLNGTPVTATVDANVLLVDWLRSEAGLTGTRVACDVGHCGVCTVLVDDMPYASCSTFVYEVDGCRVETIEGPGRDGDLSRVQASFLEHYGFQCGFCTPGMVLLATALLRANPRPSEADAREWMSANVCRCTGYQSIIRSVLGASSGAEASDDNPDQGERS